MAHIRLVNKNNEQVAEDPKYQRQASANEGIVGTLPPRIIEYGGILYRYDRKEGSINIYKQSDV